MRKNLVFVCLAILLAMTLITSCDNNNTTPSSRGLALAVDEEGLINALEAGKDVMLFKDIELSQSLNITKDTDIYLNGRTISNNVAGHAITVSGATLTIKGEGTVIGKSCAVLVKDNGTAIINGGTYKGTFGIAAGAYNSTTHQVYNGNVVINNAKIESTEFALPVWGESSLTVNNGIFTATDNAVIGTNGSSPLTSTPYKIIINGGTFNGKITSNGYIACGIYMANTGTVELNGGVFNIEGGVGVLVRSGTLTANKVSITIDEKAGLTSGKVGDSTVQITTSSQIVVDDRAGYPGAGPNVAINTTGYVLKKVDGTQY